MKSQVQQCKDLQDEIYYDPVELLKAVKQYASTIQEMLHVMEIINDALVNFFHLIEKMSLYTNI